MMSSHTARAVEQLYFTAEALTAADDNSGRGDRGRSAWAARAVRRCAEGGKGSSGRAGGLGALERLGVGKGVEHLFDASLRFAVGLLWL